MGVGDGGGWIKQKGKELMDMDNIVMIEREVGVRGIYNNGKIP